MSWGNYGVTFQGKVTLKGMRCEPCQKLWGPVLFCFVFKSLHLAFEDKARARFLGLERANVKRQNTNSSAMFSVIDTLRNIVPEIKM